MIDVDKLLMNYHELKRSLGLLEFKIENYEMYKISTERTIEEMTFTSPQGERVSNSGVSDKTARIALKYKRVTEDNNEEYLAELEERYKAQKYELNILERCITLLKNELSALITDMVINGMGADALSIKYDMSRTSIKRHYKKAVKEISEMYQELGLKETG